MNREEPRLDNGECTVTVQSITLVNEPELFFLIFCEKSLNFSWVDFLR
jgi:hypothetical protein